MSHADLAHYIRTYDNALDPALCGQMIQSFTGSSRFHNRAGRGLRAGLEESAWTELNVSQLADASFALMFRMQVDAALRRYNEDVGLRIPLPNSGAIADLVMKRYNPAPAGSEERFQLHWDSVHHLANRYLVFLWYLNDVAEGGETFFPQLNRSIAARTGRLLMFPPYWMYQHEGVAPRSGPKYIVSTYLLFTAHAPRRQAAAPGAPQVP
jgi:prolyl 4-hydroxylase